MDSVFAVPLLSSLFLLGKGRTSPLPTEYIQMLVDILLHREFVLLDGVDCSPLDPFEELDFVTIDYTGSSPEASTHSKGKVCTASNRCLGLSEMDVANFFFSDIPDFQESDAAACGSSYNSSLSNCFCPSLSLLPLVLPRRFARLHQTPAYVRLVTLALLDGVCFSLRCNRWRGSSEEVFLKSTASAIFRCLAARAIESTSTQMGRVDEEQSGIEGKVQGRAASSTHLPMPNSAKHRTQLRAWQALSCLSHHASVLDRDAWDPLTEGIWKVLDSPLMPDVRHYVEFVAVRLTLGTPQRCVPHIAQMLTRYNAARQVLISALSIGGYTLLNLRRFLPTQEEAARRMERQLLNAVIPYLTSNAAYCRATAQYLVHRFLSLEDPSLLAKANHDSDDGGVLDANPVPRLLSMLDQAKECRMMISKVAGAFDRWHPETDAGILTLIPESGILEETTEQHGEQVSKQKCNVGTVNRLKVTLT